MSLLDLKKPLQTTRGATVRVYEVFDGYCIGAWYNDSEDEWYPCAWTFPTGYVIPYKNKGCADLVNYEG